MRPVIQLLPPHAFVVRNNYEDLQETTVSECTTKVSCLKDINYLDQALSKVAFHVLERKDP